MFYMYIIPVVFRFLLIYCCKHNRLDFTKKSLKKDTVYSSEFLKSVRFKNI